MNKKSLQQSVAVKASGGEVTEVRGLEGTRVELLRVIYRCVLRGGGNPSHCSEVGHRGLLVAASLNTQGLVLVQL